MRVVRVEKQVYLQARSEEALVRRIGTFARALQMRSGSIVALERLLSAQHGKAALVCYELPVDNLSSRSQAPHMLSASGISTSSMSTSSMMTLAIDARPVAERVPGELSPAT